MLLWGDQDVFVSRSEQDQLLAAISGSTLKVYPGTGHAPHWEDPARFAGDIADFALSCGIPGQVRHAGGVQGN
jgi:pimeloyl-ACP methyl ester carboxylesterase